MRYVPTLIGIKYQHRLSFREWCHMLKWRPKDCYYTGCIGTGRMKLEPGALNYLKPVYRYRWPR